MGTGISSPPPAQTISYISNNNLIASAAASAAAAATPSNPAVPTAAPTASLLHISAAKPKPQSNIAVGENREGNGKKSAIPPAVPLAAIPPAAAPSSVSSAMPVLDKVKTVDVPAVICDFLNDGKDNNNNNNHQNKDVVDQKHSGANKPRQPALATRHAKDTKDREKDEKNASPHGRLSRTRSGINPVGRGLKARSVPDLGPKNYPSLLVLAIERMLNPGSCRPWVRHSYADPLGQVQYIDLHPEHHRTYESVPRWTFRFDAIAYESVITLKIALAERFHLHDPTDIRLFLRDTNEELSDCQRLHHYELERNGWTMRMAIETENDQHVTIFSDFERELIKSIVQSRKILLQMITNMNNNQQSRTDVLMTASGGLTAQETQKVKAQVDDLTSRLELVNREKMAADTEVTITKHLAKSHQETIKNLQIKIEELLERIQTQTDSLYRLQSDKSSVSLAALQTSMTADSQNALDDFPSPEQIIQRYDKLMKNNRFELTYKTLANTQPDCVRFVCRLIYEADELAERIWTRLKVHFNQTVSSVLIEHDDADDDDKIDVQLPEASVAILAAPFAALCRQQHKILLSPTSKHWKFILHQFRTTPSHPTTQFLNKSPAPSSSPSSSFITIASEVALAEMCAKAATSEQSRTVELLDCQKGNPPLCSRTQHSASCKHNRFNCLPLKNPKDPKNPKDSPSPTPTTQPLSPLTTITMSTAMSTATIAAPMAAFTPMTDARPATDPTPLSSGASLNFDCKCEVGGIDSKPSEHAWNCYRRQIVFPTTNGGTAEEEISRRDCTLTWQEIKSKSLTEREELIRKVDAFRDEMIHLTLQMRLCVPSFRLGDAGLGQAFDAVIHKHDFASNNKSTRITDCVYPALFKVNNTREPVTKALVICQ
jgi:hypothetical protein